MKSRRTVTLRLSPLVPLLALPLATLAAQKHLAGAKIFGR